MFWGNEFLVTRSNIYIFVRRSDYCCDSLNSQYEWTGECAACAGLQEGQFGNGMCHTCYPSRTCFLDTESSAPSTSPPSAAPTAAPVLPAIVIEKIADKGGFGQCDGEDWVSLKLSKNATQSVNLEGWVLHDDKGASDDSAYTFPDGTLLAPGGERAASEASQSQLAFGVASSFRSQVTTLWFDWRALASLASHNSAMPRASEAASIAIRA